MDAPVKTLNTEKAKALQAALAQIEKQFGKGSIMRLGEGEVIEDIEVVSTGSLGLDIALGVGGLPRGRPEPAAADQSIAIPRASKKAWTGASAVAWARQRATESR